MAVMGIGAANWLKGSGALLLSCRTNSIPAVVSSCTVIASRSRVHYCSSTFSLQHQKKNNTLFSSGVNGHKIGDWGSQVTKLYFNFYCTASSNVSIEEKDSSGEVVEEDEESKMRKIKDAVNSLDIRVGRIIKAWSRQKKVVSRTRRKKMSKVVVSTIITAFVFLVVLFIQLIIKFNHKDGYYTPNGLSRRLGLKTRDPIFDPLVAELEQKRSGKSNDGWRKKEDERYFDNDGRLKTSLRLMVLFPILDVAPNDGFIEYKELEIWNTQQAIDRLHYRTSSEMEFRDKDGDGAISFFEYLPQFTNENLEKNETSHGDAGWWMAQFRNADADLSGTLNLYELRDFMHPEDSRNEQIQRWLLREKIRQMDVNKDNMLNRLEFNNGAYNIYKTYLEYESQGTNIPTPFQAFANLDYDGDGFLTVEELKPILQYLSPGELSYAKVYTTYLIREADDDKDGKLTLDEILNHESIFYNTVYDNSRNEEIFHEEL